MHHPRHPTWRDRPCRLTTTPSSVITDPKWTDIDHRIYTAFGPPRRLAEVLSRLEDDSHLVIGLHDSARYVQFATFRPKLRLETIGPRYLEASGEALTVDQLVWLADHSWHNADDGGNLWREWGPANEGEAARAAVYTLAKIHGVEYLDQVWFESPDAHARAAFEGP